MRHSTTMKPSVSTDLAEVIEAIADEIANTSRLELYQIKILLAAPDSGPSPFKHSELQDAASRAKRSDRRYSADPWFIEIFDAVVAFHKTLNRDDNSDLECFICDECVLLGDNEDYEAIQAFRKTMAKIRAKAVRRMHKEIRETNKRRAEARPIGCDGVPECVLGRAIFDGWEFPRCEREYSHPVSPTATGARQQWGD